MKKEKAPITVIITVYNDFQYLENAIKSVLAQELLPLQIVVVDDGSDEDEAKFIVDDFTNSSEHLELIYIRKENGGASSARNYGVHHAKGEYIAFLDVDDAMLPSNLQDKYEFIKDLDESYCAVYGDARTSLGKNQKFVNIDGGIETSLIDKENIGIPGGSPFYLFKKKHLIEIGGFDENIECNEDYDLLIRFLKVGKKFKGSTGVNYYRNLRENSLSRPSNPMLSFSKVMVFLEKAAKNNYYTTEYLNVRKMETHITLVKHLLLEGRLIKAFNIARIGFEFSKPVTLKQKIVYFATFSFLL